MSWKPNAQERANQEPGICTRCGAYAQFRNTGGECTDCYNRGYDERQAARKGEVAAAREVGRTYWAARGIKPGDRVTRFAVSWFGLGGVEVHGIAKVGASGAYVTSAFQPGHLIPAGWRKA